MSTESDREAFRGRYQHTIDEKNRVTIPARWRRSTTEELVTIPERTDRCLLVIPPPEFDRLSSKIADNADISPQDRRAFIRLFNSKAKHCSVDRQGRILLPEDQCKQVRLGDEVLLVGNHRRFEIWQPEKWAEEERNDEARYQDVAEQVGL